MGRLGADPASLRRLAALFDGAGEELDGDAALIGRRIHSAPWHGRDAHRFLSEWDSAHRPALRDVSRALAAAAQQLRDQAKEQEVASGVTSGSAGGWGAAAGASAGVTADAPAGVGSLGEKATVDDWFPGPATQLGLFTGTAAAVSGFLDAGHLADAMATQRSMVAMADGLQEARLVSGVPDVAELAGGAGRVLGTVGTVFGVADVAYNAWNLADGIQEGDGGQIADSLIGGGLAVAALAVGAATPVGWAVLGAGAVWTGLGYLSSSLGYENTSDMLWDGITWVGDGVADLATGAWQGVEDAAGAVVGAGQEFLDGAGDVLGTIGGWFD